MRIGSILENHNFEKRISLTPELVKKYLSLGFEVCLIENYGSHLGIKDQQFKDMGVKISKDESEILNSSDIIVQLGMLSDDKISKIKENQTLIGVLNPFNNKEKLENLDESVRALAIDSPAANADIASPNSSVVASIGLRGESSIRPRYTTAPFESRR